MPTESNQKFRTLELLILQHLPLFCWWQCLWH